jgi:hypothetical protein
MKKSRMTKTKTAGRKRSKPKPVQKVTPVYLEPGLSIRMSLHDVIKAVKMIEKHGHLAKFTNKLMRRQAQVRLPADTVNLVKDFVADNGMHKTSMGKHIVGGRGTPTGAPRAGTISASPTVSASATIGASFGENGGDPNQCNFGKAERG